MTRPEDKPGRAVTGYDPVPHWYHGGSGGVCESCRQPPEHSNHQFPAVVPESGTLSVIKNDLDSLAAYVDGAVVDATGRTRTVLEDISHYIEALKDGAASANRPCCEETPCQWGGHPCDRKAVPGSSLRADVESLSQTISSDNDGRWWGDDQDDHLGNIGGYIGHIEAALDTIRSGCGQNNALADRILSLHGKHSDTRGNADLIEAARLLRTPVSASLPREPTQAMLDAGYLAIEQGRGAKSVWLEMAARAPASTSGTVSIAQADQRIHDAMLATRDKCADICAAKSLEWSNTDKPRANAAWVCKDAIRRLNIATPVSAKQERS